MTRTSKCPERHPKSPPLKRPSPQARCYGLEPSTFSAASPLRGTNGTRSRLRDAIKLIVHVAAESQVRATVSRPGVLGTDSLRPWGSRGNSPGFCRQFVAAYPDAGVDLLKTNGSLETQFFGANAPRGSVIGRDPPGGPPGRGAYRGGGLEAAGVRFRCSLA